MITLDIRDETGALNSVIVGIGDDMGIISSPERTYDPKSRHHLMNDTYPTEKDITLELEGLVRVLEKHRVKVYRPKSINGLNQVFSRDIGVVIGNKMIVPIIFKDRRGERKGIAHILEQIPDSQLLKPDLPVRMEGGDIIPWQDFLFVGYSKEEDFNKYKVSRTNEEAVEYLKNHFPERKVKAFELRKSDNDAYENSLHLDCCFQPLAKGKAILHVEGLKKREDSEYVLDLFGKENVLSITKEEMYHMNCNVFSVSDEVVISERGFKRLNHQLREWGFIVEEISFSEIGKMEGLLRCTTLPLKRNYVKSGH